MKRSSKVWSACFLAMVIVAAAVSAAAQNQPPLDPSHQRDVLQKQVAAEAVIAKDEAAIGRKYSKDYVDLITKGLMSKSVTDIWATPVGSAAAATVTPGVGIGDSADNLVYTPVTPCRIIDTRVAGGFLPAGGTRTFFAAGNSFAGQGGVAGSCGVPLGPTTAVVINFVAVGPVASGDMRVWPFGSAIPLASTVNYVAGSNVANGLPVAICNPAVSVCSSDITILSEGTATHIVADVQGYFSRPSAPVTQDLFAVVDASGTLSRGFRATGDILLAVGTYQPDFDRDITNCAWVADIGLSGTSGASAPGFVTVVGRVSDPTGLFIQTYNSAGVLTSLGYHVVVMCPSAPSTP